MPIILILTSDPSLEPEVEACLDGELTLAVDSLEGIEAARANFDSRPILLVDTTSFAPTTRIDADLLCVGGSAPDGIPLLERPLRKRELSSWITCLSQGGSTHDSAHQLLPSPFAEFQRDAVHDLNNQFTTLQGNLMLMADESDDPALEDMTHATAKAIQIVEWLEWMGAGEFSAQAFDLQKLIDDFAPMFFRLRGRTVFEAAPSGQELFVRKDPQRLLALLIVMVDAMPGQPQSCTLSCGTLGEKAFIRCEDTGPSTPPLELPEITNTWLSALNAEVDLQPQQWTLSFS